MKGFLKNLLLVLVSVLVALLLSEGLLRLLDRVHGVSAVSLQGEDVIDLAAMNYNTRSVRRAKPSSELFRILSFGDSFAYTIMETEHSYHQIAAEVATESGGRPVEVVNLGEPAVSFYQYMKAYRVFGTAIEHDTAVFNVYLGNDLLDVAYGYVADDVGLNRLFGNLELDRRTGRSQKVRIPEKYPLRLLDHGYALYLMASGQIQTVDTGTRDSVYNFALAELAENVWLETLFVQLDNFDPGKVDALRDGYVAAVQFARFVDEIVSRGTPVLILLSPNQAQVETRTLERVLYRFGVQDRNLDLDLSARLLSGIFRNVAPGASVAYLRQPLACADSEGHATYFGTDTHWSAEGNRVVGEVLGAWISSEWLDNEPVSQHPCAGHLQDRDALDPDSAVFDHAVAPLIQAAPAMGRLK